MTYAMAAKGDSAEILVYEDIGEGFFGGLSAKTFAKDLRALGNVKTINLRINSPGGDVFDGHSIYRLLMDHKAKKVVYVDGLAASIASIIAMAGDEIHMADGAMMMIHPAWGMAVGDAEELRSRAKLLETISLQMRDIYVKKTGKEQRKIWDMMQAETWMTAGEALDLGFATHVDGSMKMAACAVRGDLYRYKNMPKALTNPVDPAQVARAAGIKERLEAYKTRGVR